MLPATIFLFLSNMKTSAKVHQPEDKSGIINTPEKINEEDTKVVVGTNEKDNNAKATTEDNEG